MKRHSIIVVLILAVASTYGIELVEVRRWDLDLQGFPAVVAEFEKDHFLLSVGGSIFRAGGDLRAPINEDLGITEGHEVFDMDYSAGRLALVTGYSGGPSEVTLHNLENGSKKNLSGLIDDPSAITIRRARWMNEREVIVEFFRLSPDRQFGQAALVEISAERRATTSRLEAHDLRLLAVSTEGTAILVQVYGEGGSITRRYIGDRTVTINEPNLVAHAVAISDTEFLLMGIEKLHYLEITGAQSELSALDIGQTSVLSMDYNAENDIVYILSDPPGDGLLVVEYQVTR